MFLQILPIICFWFLVPNCCANTPNSHTTLFKYKYVCIFVFCALLFNYYIAKLILTGVFKICASIWFNHIPNFWNLSITLYNVYLWQYFNGCFYSIFPFIFYWNINMCQYSIISFYSKAWKPLYCYTLNCINYFLHSLALPTF